MGLLVRCLSEERETQGSNLLFPGACPRRWNMTTSMVGLKNGHMTKISPKNEPHRYSWERRISGAKRLESYYPVCKAPGIVGSVLGLVGPVSIYCDWDSKFDLQLLWQCGSKETKILNGTFPVHFIVHCKRPDHVLEWYFSCRRNYAPGVNMGSDSIPTKTLLDESINWSLVCAHMHSIVRTHVLEGWMPTTKTPSRHDPWRRNVTTSMVRLKNGHITQRSHPKWWIPEI